MKAKVEFDYPTIEGMIYKDTIIVCEESDFNSRVHDEKVKGKSDTGKIVWIPKKGELIQIWDSEEEEFEGLGADYDQYAENVYHYLDEDAAMKFYKSIIEDTGEDIGKKVLLNTMRRNWWDLS